MNFSQGLGVLHLTQVEVLSPIYMTRILSALEAQKAVAK